MKVFFLISSLIMLGSSFGYGQVQTNFKSDRLISIEGVFKRDYAASILKLDAPDEKSIENKLREDSLSVYVKPSRIAEPIPCDIDVVKTSQWITDAGISYMKFSLSSEKAKSLSFNFNKFYLPKSAEMFIYNKDGRTITGPVTYAENNELGIWGSSIYQGDILTIEVKIQAREVPDLKLNISNVAFGIKELYGFGNSSPCNINVLCPEGNGWEQERRSVALILNQNGSVWCSGALVNNTCSNNLSYFLTANHCIENENVANWRFVFQYWSPNCTPTQDDYTNINTTGHLRFTQN